MIVCCLFMVFLCYLQICEVVPDNQALHLLASFCFPLVPFYTLYLEKTLCYLVKTCHWRNSLKKLWFIKRETATRATDLSLTIFFFFNRALLRDRYFYPGSTSLTPPCDIFHRFSRILDSPGSQTSDLRT